MIGNIQHQWLETGDAYYAALLSAIGSARESVRLESYIFSAGKPGDDLRAALIAAAQRGVKVKVLTDSFGSMELPADYWAGLVAAGGEHRKFNPIHLLHIAFRNHRKVLVCDSSVAFVGGFNITPEELGDGTTRGWRDLGLCMRGEIARQIAASFDIMYDMAAVKQHRLQIPKFIPRHPAQQAVSLLTCKPGQWQNPIKRSLRTDLRHAHNVSIISAYFLPSLRIRRELVRIARRGGSVRVITAGRTDVALARFAARSLYKRLLRSHIHVFEYETQVLHTKLIVIDDAVYAGSANLDTRSLNINYELLVRIEDRKIADEARRIVDSHIPHCNAIKLSTWSRSRNIWQKIAERLAHFALAHLDTFLARRLSKLR